MTSSYCSWLNFFPCLHPQTSSSFPALRWLPVPWLLLLLRNLLPGQPSLERSSDLVSLHMDQRSGCPPLTVLG
ncbi:hypothetical protein GOODEAATRI_018662 [Goodea atripinnis]|uniref:Uncharacterized protein n=1 Tax=Goodea atripinnis TaxID=208336 RepID=A0ABV0PQ65_9TELE